MDPRLYPKEKPVVESTEPERSGPLFAVEFVKKDGERYGFPYSMLSMASYSPEDGLIATFGTVRVKVVGIGIETIYRGLLRREVDSVVESAGEAGSGVQSDVWVERIVVEVPTV